MVAGLIWGFAVPAFAAARLPTLTVQAKDHAYRNVIVSVVLPATYTQKAHLASAARLRLVPTDKSMPLPAQTDAEAGQARLTFLIPDLPQGATRVYHLQELRGRHREADEITARMHGDDVDISTDAGDTLFTRYNTRSGPNKPYFYPIFTPEGLPMTRRWPLEPNANESHDHPHHRGLWFTHSSVNGIDFWSEQNTDKVKVGRTIVKAVSDITSGSVWGGFRTTTEWRAPDDKLIAMDTRTIRVYRIGSDRIMDFTITLQPVGAPLIFGDNKDGMFGLRLPDSLAPHPDKSAPITMPTGHIVTASGQKDGAAWGKPNDWVDYYGPLGLNGQTYGVAIFDDPQNLRHPETWHARDYGLFTANPFALHDFGLGAKGAGDYTVPIDHTLTFRYRLLFHEGDTLDAHVAAQYQNYADPPEVIIN